MDDRQQKNQKPSDKGKKQRQGGKVRNDQNPNLMQTSQARKRGEGPGNNDVSKQNQKIGGGSSTN